MQFFKFLVSLHFAERGEIERLLADIDPTTPSETIEAFLAARDAEFAAGETRDAFEASVKTHVSDPDQRVGWDTFLRHINVIATMVGIVGDGKKQSSLEVMPEALAPVPRDQALAIYGFCRDGWEMLAPLQAKGVITAVKALLPNDRDGDAIVQILEAFCAKEVQSAKPNDVEDAEVVS